MIKKDAESFEKKAEIVEKDSEKNFEMLKKKSDQIKELKKINEMFTKFRKMLLSRLMKKIKSENNIMNISSDYNVVKDTIVTVKIKN